MTARRWLTLSAAAVLTSLAISAPVLPQPAAPNPFQPPAHTMPFPDLGVGATREERVASYAAGPQLQIGVSPQALLEQHRRLDAAVSALAPQRPGVSDVYVLAIALDSDPVFAREAREAARVLTRRYDAAERSIALAGPDGLRDDLPHGSMEGLALAIGRIGKLMDPAEDVLVLYTTSHGMELGLAYHYGDSAFGVVSPAWLSKALESAGITRRIVLISACFSGVFVPVLGSPDTAIVTAAASTRTSFGCEAENDWTFFGDALINHALRQPVALSAAAQMAKIDIAKWETAKGYPASLPQVAIGAKAASWLNDLEARLPQTPTAPVGRPAIGR